MEGKKNLGESKKSSFLPDDGMRMMMMERAASKATSAFSFSLHISINDFFLHLFVVRRPLLTEDRPYQIGSTAGPMYTEQCTTVSWMALSTR